METIEKLAYKASALKPIEKLKLVEIILYSLDKIDPEIEKAWLVEAEARYEAYKRGELKSIDWEDIKKRYK